MTGTAVHDPADTEQRLGAYVATGEPQWSVDYLEIDGKNICFLTVEAPEEGDPIFTLRRAFILAISIVSIVNLAISSSSSSSRPTGGWSPMSTSC